MHRRQFLTDSVGTAALAAAAMHAHPGGAAAHTPPKPRPVRMKIGHQHHSADPELSVMAAFGVNNICSALPSAKLDDAWSVEGLTKLRERVERSGISLDMVPLPLSSSPVGRSENPSILLGKSPERDREIDSVCALIERLARAGIPAAKYNMNIIGIPRTAPQPGRGGSAPGQRRASRAKNLQADGRAGEKNALASEMGR